MTLVVYHFEHADGRPWEGGKVVFRRRPVSATETIIHPSDFIVSDRLDAGGTGSQELAPNDTDLPENEFVVTVPTGEVHTIIIPDQDTPFDLTDAIRATV